MSPGAVPHIKRASLLLALFVVSPARAVEIDFEIGTGGTGSARLGDVWFVSPLLALGVPISDNVDMAVTWGFTIATASDATAGDDATRVQSGSPMLAFPWRLSEGLVFAPGITLPVADLPESEDDPAFAIATAAINGGRGIRGRIDEWLWLPAELGFVFPVHWAKWADPLVIEIDLAVAYVIPTSDADPDDDFLLQAAARVAWRLAPDAWLGVRFAATFIPTNTGDNAQVSIAPEARWVFSKAGGYASARFHINLDTPYGPSFEAGRLWGLHLGTGWSL